MSAEDRVKHATRKIVALLVEGDYASAEQQTNGVRLTAAEMQTAIEEYGRHLLMPPQEAFEAMSIIEIEDSDQKAWSVTLDLWTIEEGRSDLSVEMTVVDEGKRTRVELDNIHVQ